MEYWDHSCSIWLKNNTVHGINKQLIAEDDLHLNYYLNFGAKFRYYHRRFLTFSAEWSRNFLACFLSLRYKNQKSCCKELDQLLK